MHNIGLANAAVVTTSLF